jgi:hypothetical protein
MKAKKSCKSRTENIPLEILADPTTELIKLQFEYIRQQEETIRTLTSSLNASRLATALSTWDKPKNKGGRPPSKLEPEEILRILGILKAYIKKKNETKYTAKKAAELMAGAVMALDNADDYPNMSHDQIILQWRGRAKTSAEKVMLKQKSRTWENIFAAAKKSQKLNK